MGKGSRMAAALLEKLLQFIYSALTFSLRLFLKAIKREPHKQVPSTSLPILLQSATSLSSKIRSREFTSQLVVETFISRIKEINPQLNFLVNNRFEEAIIEAKQVDEFLKSTHLSVEEIAENTPFLGVPMTVKESLAVKGMSHTGGVISRRSIIAGQHASVVQAMTRAGAIPIGVTNTPEVCCWWETYNPLHGRTSNPYDTTRSAGGSSGGEAAAIAAAASVIGLASDFAGSIRVPAAFNGIFGHRPTSLTAPVDGHYPIPANPQLRPMLTTGPITRYASDLRPIVKIITKELAPNMDLTSKVDFKSVTVYYMEEADMFLTSSVQPAIQEAVRKTSAHFQSLGAKIEKLQLEDMRYAMMYWFAQVKTDDGPQLGKELANHQGSVSMAAEFCKTLVGASKHTLPIVLFGVLEAANGVPCNGLLHKAVLNKYEHFKRDLKEKLKDGNILIVPAHPTTALRHGEALARPLDLGYAAVFNALGLPATCCPVSTDAAGLPVAVQVVADAYQDRLTLAAAELIEQAFGGWTPPYPS